MAKLRLLVVVLAALLLSGCVDYDIGIRFDSQNHGVITQTLHVSDRLLTLSPSSSDQWLDRFAARARRLSGKTRRIDRDTLQVRLPFANGSELVDRFNTLFSPDETSLFNELPGSNRVVSRLELSQNNRLVAQRNHLTYDLDLSALSTAADPILELIKLDFAVIGPWGVRPIAAIGTAPRQEGNATHWPLSLDQPNHIEAVFWVPSPIGIGALVVILVTALGYIAKYGLPKQNISPESPQPPSGSTQANL
ncbi:DUF3153 domain-containing protein [Romeria aff. gracilis LEGE 07310]|uniref:DUF3153 domain-containing protein n=1 Tax=Vasconcelosia minhoensis LEGE 07310 TaxID=915328 RepID=A0A8J7DK70_9CYAN|nr:DUF3153 domain-containing protein [Romeria gracilis]MBE9076026.1 DUF3153 domain-containing protein [Romeria aff. gracilis LEGE 07310]